MADKLEAMIMADSIRIRMSEKIIRKQEIQEDWVDFSQGLKVVDRESAMSFESQAEQDVSLPNIDCLNITPIISRKQTLKSERLKTKEYNPEISV